MNKIFSLVILLACLACAENTQAYRVTADFSGEGLAEAKPRVVTRSGQAAEIQIGKSDQPGWTLSVTPTAGADPQSVKLDGSVQVRGQGEPERFQFNTQARLGEPIRIEVGERWSTRLTVELAE